MYAARVRQFSLALSFLLVCATAHADVGELVGQPAPTVRARAMDSNAEVTLEQYRGKVVLLAFVASWCSVCRRVAPELERLHDAHAGDDFALIAMSHESRARIRRHLEETPRRYPTLQCTGRTAVSYQADGLPTLVLIDREGRVRRAYQGGDRGNLAALRREVAELLAEH